MELDATGTALRQIARAHPARFIASTVDHGSHMEAERVVQTLGAEHIRLSDWSAAERLAESAARPAP